jgi:tRNA-specific adenosine deaminase 1
LPKSTIDDDGFYRTAVSTIIDTYTQLGHKPQNSAWTVLASFFLSRKPNLSAGTSGEIKVISLATGTKCIPASRLSKRGEVVHDSHAEVLARRCAFRWFLEEILRVHPSQSDWITKSTHGKYTLQEGVELNLYISTVPCAFLFLTTRQHDNEISNESRRRCIYAFSSFFAR